MQASKFLVFAAFAGAVAGCVRERPQAVLAPPPWLEPQADHQAAVSAPGAQRIGDFFRGAGWRREQITTDWYVPLEAGSCYFFSSAASGGVDRLHLYLWDQNRKRVAQARSDSSAPLLAFCPKDDGMYHLQARVARGEGHFVVGMYARPGGHGPMETAAPSAPPGPAAEPWIADPRPEPVDDYGWN
jgi:hypothetical protein